MHVNAQPPSRRGTVGHPYSALNLRLALAAFGLAASVLAAILLFRIGLDLGGWLLAACALVAAADLIVIQLRRSARRHTDPEDHSLFE